MDAITHHTREIALDGQRGTSADLVRRRNGKETPHIGERLWSKVMKVMTARAGLL